MTGYENKRQMERGVRGEEEARTGKVVAKISRSRRCEDWRTKRGEGEESC